MPIGASPGTLQPAPDAKPPQIAALGYGPQGVIERKPIGLDAIAALRQSCNVTWIDVTGFGDVATLQRLGEMFGLHRLALEDVVNVPPRSTVRIAWMPDDRPGSWMFHCHILEHHAAGMMGEFEVVR